MSYIFKNTWIEALYMKLQYSEQNKQAISSFNVGVRSAYGLHIHNFIQTIIIRSSKCRITIQWYALLCIPFAAFLTIAHKGSILSSENTRMLISSNKIQKADK